MHNHDGKNDRWMMWFMMLCCAAPLLLIVLFGSGGKALGAPTWVIVGGIALMMLVHFFMTGKSHKHSDEKHDTGEKDVSTNNKENKNHSGHTCCH